MLVMTPETTSFARRTALLQRFSRQQQTVGEGVLSYREAMPSGGAAAALPEALPVVLLHGIGSGAASWVDQLARLGTGRRVLAWDAPGYGASTPVSASEPVAADYAVVLRVFLAHHGIDRCVLVGHSLGAIMAASFAASAPECVAGLLLLSPAGGYGKADPAVRIAKRDARLKMIDTLQPDGMAQARSANMVSVHADDGAREWVRQTMSQVHIGGYRQATHLLANANLTTDLLVYRHGKLAIVAGAEDTITTPAACEKIAGTAGVSLRIVPRVGHAAYIEAPDAYSALIEDFCIDCDRQSPRGAGA